MTEVSFLLDKITEALYLPYTRIINKQLIPLSLAPAFDQMLKLLHSPSMPTLILSKYTQTDPIYGTIFQ